MSKYAMGISGRMMLYIAIAAVCLLLLISLAPVLTPFMVAALFAYLMNPLVDKLTFKRVNRTMAVSMIFLAMTLLAILVLLLVVPMLFNQLVSFVHRLPGYFAVLQAYVLPQLQQIGVDIQAVPVEDVQKLLKDNWQQAGGIVSQLIKGATASAFSVMGFVANLLLVPVVAFYLMRDWKSLLGFLKDSLPSAWRDRVLALTRECDEVLSAFIRGQLLVMASLAVIYSIGLGIVGLDLALFLGTLAGLASVVPYLGAIVGIGASAIVAYMQFYELMPIVYVCMVFGIGQLLEGMLLTPMLVGDKIGLHPVAVIFAIMAGGQLAGFVGVLIALPVAAVVMVFVRHLHRHYQSSQLFLHIDDE